jgi:peptidoglycan/xylan/chitin deacetylase (PgdA/CDA1 family)
MRLLMIILALNAGIMTVPALSQGKTEKIAIIKADDVRQETKNWQRFFDLSREKGVKVSAGIICNSLEGDNKKYSDWLNKLQASGWVEFWNHGWDHSRGKETKGKSTSEFSKSGYPHQKKHFDDSQAIMKRVLGSEPIALGTGYNAVDSDTVKVMNESSTLRIFFGYSNPDGLKDTVVAPMKLKGEHDGTGKPNFQKFKEDYQQKKNLTFTAIQFHPNGFSPQHFDEYSKILDFLISEGWTFMLPKEYIAKQDQAKHVKPSPASPVLKSAAEGKPSEKSKRPDPVEASSLK